jgi:hypothetical protein
MTGKNRVTVTGDSYYDKQIAHVNSGASPNNLCILDMSNLRLPLMFCVAQLSSQIVDDVLPVTASNWVPDLHSLAHKHNYTRHYNFTTLSHVLVTTDRVWIHQHLFHTTRDYRGGGGTTRRHTLVFSVFSRILATDLSQSVTSNHK